MQYALASGDMELNHSRIEPGGIAVVAPSGRLTLGREAREFESAVAALIAQGERKLVLDCRELDYIDSAGLGVILASASNAKQAGAELRLANVGSRVMQVFKLTRTDTVLQVTANLETAAASF